MQGVAVLNDQITAACSTGRNEEKRGTTNINVDLKTFCRRNMKIKDDRAEFVVDTHRKIM